MDNQNPLSNSLKNQQFKDRAFYIAQKRKFTQYLILHTATCSMVCEATGIPQKNATRYKRQLEENGLLAEIRKAICKTTGYYAWYLTCNPTLFKAPSQLKKL